MGFCKFRNARHSGFLVDSMAASPDDGRKQSRESNYKENDMSHRQPWVLGAAILIGCLIIGAFFGRPTNAQEKKAPAEASVGRYNLIQSDEGRIVVLDTATGHCWSNADAGDPDKWHDIGTPGQTKKE
jgi:hypothetical protein